MRKYFAILLFLSYLSQSSQAQDLHDWTTISYMNDVTDVEYVNGEIWAGTTGGIYRFNPVDSTYIKYTNIEGLVSLNISAITQNHKGEILAASQDGIIYAYLPDLNLWKSYLSMKNQQITDLLSYADTLWVATNRGVGVFLNSNSELEFRDFYDNLPIQPVKAFAINVFNNRLFYATQNGLLYTSANFFKHNLKIADAWKILSTEDGLPSKTATDLAPYQNSLLIATAAGGVSLSSDFEISQLEDWTAGRIDHIVASNDKLYFLKSTEYYEQVNDVWIRSDQFENVISSGTIDEDGRLWLGLINGGLRKDLWTKSFKINGPGSNHVGIIIQDKQKNLWMTSGKFKLQYHEGFYKYDFKSWTNYKFSGGEWTRKNSTDYIYEDKMGNIWIGAWGGGVTVVSDTSLYFFHAWSEGGSLAISTASEEKVINLEGLPPERRSCLVGAEVGGSETYTVITHFIEDASSNIWFPNYLPRLPEYLTIVPLNDESTSFLDCSGWTYLGDQIGMSLEEGEISSMEFDDFSANPRLWMGTFRRGILVLDYNQTPHNPSDDQLFRLNMSNYNLFSNTILCIKKDHDGTLWIGTDAGLNSYQSDGVNLRFFKHVGETGPIENKINQIFVDRNNNKWFATDGGLSILKGDKSPWDSDAWVHYTTGNSGLPSSLVNSVFVDEDDGKAYLGTESGLSIFSGAFSEFKPDFSSLSGGPNPFILDGTTNFILKNLAFNSKVKILNINGRMVKELNQENGFVFGSRATWDGTDLNNKLVPSGIYLYLVFNEEGLKGTGKIPVIKP